MYTLSSLFFIVSPTLFLSLTFNLKITSQGYQGLVEGGDNIKLAHWHSVTNIIQQVGYSIVISHC